jgi:uncharacterized membrane protein
MKSALTQTGERRTGGHIGVGPAVFAVALALLLFVSALPPTLTEGGRYVVMSAFSPLCHQIADRSFAIGGLPLALCHRCTGILAGMLMGLVLSVMLAVRGRSMTVFAFAPHTSVLLAVAFAPLAVDWGMDVVGLWANTPWSRVLTGVWTGAGLGVLLASSLLPAGTESRHLEDSAPQG